MALFATHTLLQDAAAATGNGTTAALAGFKRFGVQVSGTFTGTVTFEGTLDGTNYIAVGMAAVGTGTVATTATAAGIFYLPDEVTLISFRARVSAYTSGSITVKAVVEAGSVC